MLFIIFENCHDLWLKKIPKEVETLQWRVLAALNLPNINHIKVWSRSQNYNDLAAEKDDEIGTVVNVILLKPIHFQVIKWLAREIDLFLTAHDMKKDSWIFINDGITKYIFHEVKMLGQKPENPTVSLGDGSSNNPDDGSF